MHDMWFRVSSILNDTWQNIALVVLLGDRIRERRLVDRTLRAIERETADGTMGRRAR